MFGHIKSGMYIWAVECSATALPAGPGVFARYFVHPFNRSKLGPQEKRLLGAERAPLVRQVAEAGIRILAKPSYQTKALDVSLIKKVISRLEHGNLVYIQVA